MLFLGHSHITEVVQTVGLHRFVDGLTSRMRDALLTSSPETLETPPRDGFHYVTPTSGLIEWMPTHDRGRAVGVKTVAYHPSNPQDRRLPTVTASTALYDTCGGRQIALVDATLLTALRTGAASALATSVFAQPDSIRLGIIGCGAQAVAQAHAISRVRHVNEIVAYDTNSTVAHTLQRRLGRLDLPVRIVEQPFIGLIRETSDVICTVTSVEPGNGPVFADGTHAPWLHINAVGSDFPGKTELPSSLLQRATVVMDHRDQCCVEGESQQLTDPHLGPELSDVMKNEADWISKRDSLTVFDSTGYSLFDLIAAEYATETAQRLGVGIDLDLGITEGDPYDPYVSLNRDAFR